MRVSLADRSSVQRLVVFCVAAALLSEGDAHAQSVLLTVDGADPGGAFGSAVDGIDQDGDGLVELLIGAPADDTAGAGAGSFSIRSSVDGSILLLIDGAPGSSLGSSLRNAGDVDGDGGDDALVGAPTGSASGVAAGDVFLHRGVDGGLLLQFSGAGFGDGFGHSMDRAGDVDQDGVVDFAVGANMADFGASNSGSVYVFSGFDGSLIHRFDGPNAGDVLGASVAGIGDIDDDGFDDVAAGAEFGDGNGSSSGDVRVYSGSSGAFLFSVSGDTAGARLGHSLAALGDTDGDTVPDFAAGAPFSDLGGINSGFVGVYSGAGGALLQSLTGESGAEFGASVVGVGDQNRDDLGDLLIGAVQSDGTVPASGRARLFSGADGFEILGLDGDESNESFGFAVGSAGDQDGDGFADLLVGAPGHGGLGRVSLFSGCDGANAPYGVGCAGSGGFVPTLRLQGCPLREVPLAIEVKYALGGAPVVLHFGLEKANLPLSQQCDLLVSPVAAPVFVFLADGVGPGDGDVVVPVVIPIDHAPGTITFQAFSIDPGAVPGFAASNGVLATIPP